MSMNPYNLNETIKQTDPETYNTLTQLALIIAISDRLGKTDTRDNAQWLFNTLLDSTLDEYTVIWHIAR